jgi:hypothetical protein
MAIMHGAVKKPRPERRTDSVAFPAISVNIGAYRSGLGGLSLSFSKLNIH